VVPDVGRDVLARDDRLHQSADLRLRRRERAGALLLGLRRPVRGPVAVEVETFEWRRDRDRDAVPVADRPFPQHAEVLALDVVGPPRDGRARESLPFAVRGRARDERAGVAGMRLPGAVRVRHTHEQDAAVPIDVLTVETVPGLVTWLSASAID